MASIALLVIRYVVGLASVIHILPRFWIFLLSPPTTTVTRQPADGGDGSGQDGDRSLFEILWESFSHHSVAYIIFSTCLCLCAALYTYLYVIRIPIVPPGVPLIGHIDFKAAKVLLYCSLLGMVASSGLWFVFQ